MNEGMFLAKMYVEAERLNIGSSLISPGDVVDCLWPYQDKTGPMFKLVKSVGGATITFVDGEVWDKYDKQIFTIVSHTTPDFYKLRGILFSEVRNA